MPNIKAHIICHTHWDREWYLSKNEFKTKMVRLVDSVLHTIETNDAISFMLDGQTIILEDYMEIRPENKERITAAIQSGKLSAGPWYVLPDEILISGEAHIHNYMTGRRVAASFGGAMNIGYLPDSFGHPEQMPQILKGLSMDTAIFWRGVPNDISHSEFNWQSTCKKVSVLAVNLPYGYGNSARLSQDMEVSGPRLREMMEKLTERTCGGVVLLMNGSDHILNQTDIADIVDDFNKKNAPDYEIEISTLPAFLEALKSTLAPLSQFKGELRSGDRSMLLSGTMSTRIALKQWNTRVQREMERYLEPVLALRSLCGEETDEFCGYQQFLWKKILENHPHDSICGCSVDAVSREMMVRFDAVNQLQKTLYHDAIRSFPLQKNEEAAHDVQLLHFEPTQDGLPAYVEAEVDFDPMLVQCVNFAKS
ncbi:MAG: hypothetical protein RSD23_08560, partial [Ruthenibacterium sp.]